MSIISAQVSLYPLKRADLSPAIYQALNIFREHGLDVTPGSMSTLITGDEATVFAALQAAFQHAARQGRVVMVTTFSNVCPPPKAVAEQREIQTREETS
jgi:uncharacterized protein YqgV (UPF0045/DUF77 family)